MQPTTGLIEWTPRNCLPFTMLETRRLAQFKSHWSLLGVQFFLDLFVRKGRAQFSSRTNAMSFKQHCFGDLRALHKRLQKGCMTTVLPALQELRKRHMSAARVSKNDCMNHAKATLHVNIDHTVLAQLKEKRQFGGASATATDLLRM